MINMQPILALGSMQVSIATLKTQTPNVSQQNLQGTNISSLKEGKNSISPKRPDIVIKTVGKKTQQSFLSVSEAPVQEYKK